MKTLEGILERKAQRRKALEQGLAPIVAQLRDLGARKVVLFGSLAQGDTGAWSDLDLLAVMPSARSSREWIREVEYNLPVYAEVERTVACDFLVYTGEDLQAMLPTSHFLRHALKEGKVVYETESPRRSTTLADPSLR
jgi:predicted nucleotidyltransferase